VKRVLCAAAFGLGLVTVAAGVTLTLWAWTEVLKWGDDQGKFGLPLTMLGSLALVASTVFYFTDER
jgi:hypothetical protein